MKYTEELIQLHKFSVLLLYYMGFMRRNIFFTFFILSFIFLSKVMLLNYFPDFSGYYFGPQLFLRGENPYLGGKDFFTPFVYPPFVLLFFYPLHMVPFLIAGKLWTFFSLIFLLLSLKLFLKIYKENLFSPHNLILFSMLFLSFFPVKFTLGMGQINMLILFLVISFLYFYQKKNDYFSGFFLGISILLKLFPVLLIPYLIIERRWRVLSALFLTGICFIGVTYAASPEITIYFIKKILPDLLTGWKGDYYNQAVSGFLERQFHDNSFREIIKLLLSSFLFLLSFFIIFKNKKKDMYVTNLKISVLILLTLMINTFSWQHHYVWYLIPLLSTFFYVKHKKFHVNYFIILGISYLLVAYNIKTPSRVPIVLQSHVLFGALILWFLDIYLLFKKELKVSYAKKSKKKIETSKSRVFRLKI